jgi:hypothetical protein
MANANITRTEAVANENTAKNVALFLAVPFISPGALFHDKALSLYSGASRMCIGIWMEKALMWERWQKRESLEQIAQLFALGDITCSRGLCPNK